MNHEIAYIRQAYKKIVTMTLSRVASFEIFDL